MVITTSKKTASKAATATKPATASKTSSKAKGAKMEPGKQTKDNSHKYEQYYDFSLPVRHIRPHQVSTLYVICTVKVIGTTSQFWIKHYYMTLDSTAVEAYLYQIDNACFRKSYVCHSKRIVLNVSTIFY